MFLSIYFFSSAKLKMIFQLIALMSLLKVATEHVKLAHLLEGKRLTLFLFCPAVRQTDQTNQADYAHEMLRCVYVQQK